MKNIQRLLHLIFLLLALPAGVWADITDRRRLIEVALITQAVTGVALAALLLAGWAGPTTLLLLIFLSGCCTALLSPAWNSTINDAIPRDERCTG